MEDSASGQADEASEYGSDFTPGEEEILNGLLQLQSVPEIADNPITDPELQYQDAEEDEGPQVVRSSSSRQIFESQVANQQLSVQLDNHTKASTNVESHFSRAERESSVPIETPLDPTPEVPDLRSPLERFRTKHKKALSVTDLISPSWCELQYWYALTRYGRKRRTPAMQQGSKVHAQTGNHFYRVNRPLEMNIMTNSIQVHKTLEDQVHVTVQVDIKTDEDKMGLRIWNTIQGLRTLRETGMTRELGIWGLLDGQVINGVIDELAYTCPDRELEAAAEKQRKGTTKKTPVLAPDQATITEYLNPRGSLETSGLSFANALHSSQSKSESAESSPRIYISDIKTRGIRSLPKGASFRPTLMQLLLYHRLLADLATGKVDSELLLERYDLDPNLPFSDSLIAQVGNLNQADWSAEVSNPSTQESVPTLLQDSMTILLAHNSLNMLWSFMIQEFKTTFPLGAKSLGSVLKAEYRDSSTSDIIGSKTILYDHDTLEEYLSEEMEWWRGERSARGVSVEEAYKCGSCEFAEGCEWRANKINDHVKLMRSRSKV